MADQTFFPDTAEVEEAPARRPRDAVSLVFGLLYVGAAVLFLVGDLTDVRLELEWAAPALLISCGLLGLIASVRRSSRARLGHR